METVTISRTEYDELKPQNQWLLEQLGLARKRQSGSVEDVVPKGIPTEVVEHRLAGEEHICSACGAVIEEIGKEVHRSLKMEPARFWIQEDVYYTYACKNCEQETGEANIVKTPKEPVIYPGSFASPGAAAHIMTQKFVMYSPLYRLELEFGRQGLKLSRQTMSNWILNVSDAWLWPVYDVPHRELCREKVLHGDETTLQVLKEAGKSAASKSYMWLYRTSGCRSHSIILYEYQSNRKAEHAEEFLDGFSGWLHADGYQGYHKPPERIRVVGCWAHARRKFDEALQTLAKDARAGSLAATGECYCTRLFQLEESFAELTPGGTIYQAAGAGKACSGRFVGVGKRDDLQNGVKIRSWKGIALSAGAVAVPGTLSGRWQTGTEQ